MTVDHLFVYHLLFRTQEGVVGTSRCAGSRRVLIVADRESDEVEVYWVEPGPRTEPENGPAALGRQGHGVAVGGCVGMAVGRNTIIGFGVREELTNDTLSLRGCQARKYTARISGAHS